MKRTFAKLTVKTTYSPILLFIVFTFIILPISPTPKSFALEHNRAAWVIRWHMDTPDEITSICREANNGLDSLLVQVRGRADAYYKSDLAPRAEELAPLPAEFDPLAFLSDQCRNKPIQAWMNVFYLWTGKDLPISPQHPAQPGNQWILTDNNGRKVSEYSELEQAQKWIEGIYADPASQEYRTLFVKIVKEVATNYPVQGIHLDFVRYPGFPFGHGSLAEEFQDNWGLDPRLLPETIAPADLQKWYSGEMNRADRLLITGALIWSASRVSQVTDLVRQVRNTLDATGKKYILSASIFPDYLPAFLEKGQDWLSWAREGLVDELYAMAYFGGPERVSRQIEEVVQFTSGSKAVIWAGLGAYIKTTEEIQEEAALISRLKLKGISLFSLGHLIKKKGRIKPYVTALKTGLPLPFADGKKEGHDVDHMLIALIQNLAHTDRNALLQGQATDPVLRLRIGEFVAAQETLFDTVKKLGRNSGSTPDWLEMNGIFRYVHPFDSADKKKEQKKLCETARTKMLAGANMRNISKEFSQAGSRRFQSRLPRYYLSKDKEKDKILGQLQPGQVSPVLEEEKGYWCYKIMARGKAEPIAFDAMPWPARRILFRELLLARINQQPQL